jgi:hypothetical protein
MSLGIGLIAFVAWKWREWRLLFPAPLRESRPADVENERIDLPGLSRGVQIMRNHDRRNLLSIGRAGRRF